MDTNVLLLLLGGILVLGVLGNYLFSKTLVPTPVILILLGILLGPATGSVSTNGFHAVAPHFGTIALILILFEGGLELEVKEAIQQFTAAALLGVFYFVFCALGVTMILYYGFGADWKLSLLSGFILGGTSPVVILPIAGMLSISQNLKTLLVLETAISELLTVISVVIFTDALRDNAAPDALTLARHIGLSTILSMLMATIAAGLWSRVMHLLAGASLSYMLTLGAVFVLYALAGLVGAEPALTILCFGLILGNTGLLAKRLARLSPKLFRDLPQAIGEGASGTLRHMNAELSFLVRTFFMVTLGMVFDFSRLTVGFVASAITILLLLVFARWATLRVLGPRLEVLKNEKQGELAILAMLPRGLACAVMAMTAARSGLPDAGLLVTFAFLVILGSNLIMTGFVIAHEKRVKEALPTDPIPVSSTS